MEKVSSWIAVGVGGYEVFEAYEKGEDWQAEIVGQAVAITIAIMLGSAIFGAISLAGLPLFAVIGISILIGIAVGEVSKILGVLFKKIYEYSEDGFLSLQMQNSLSRYS